MRTKNLWNQFHNVSADRITKRSPEKTDGQNGILHFRHYRPMNGRRRSGYFKLIKWLETSKGNTFLTQSFGIDCGLLCVWIFSPRRDCTIICTAFELNIFTYFSSSFLSLPTRFDIFGLMFNTVFAELILFLSCLAFLSPPFSLQLVSLLRIYTNLICYILINVDQFSKQ